MGIRYTRHTMKQTLIKITDDHYIVVDDSEIKEDCYALHEGPLGEREIVTANGQCKLDKKITHSTQPNKGMENVTFISPREVKELIGEVDVEKKAELNGHPESSQFYSYREGFIDGYNEALEDNKDKKYTEEDMINWTMCMISQYVQGNTNIWNKDLLRKSLPTPKTQWEVTFDEQGKLRLV